MKQKITLALSVLLLIAGNSCNVSKRAERKFYKALALDKQVVYQGCGDVAPPVEMTKDSFIYLPGKPIIRKGQPVYIELDCDSAVKAAKATGAKNAQVQIKCPPSDTVIIIDTVYKSRKAVQVNRAKEYQLQKQVEVLKEKNTKQAATINTLWWVVGILGLYTILRWILKRFFKISIL